MPKRISERQRLITYASQATEDQLSEAIETFLAIRAGRFPKAKAKRKSAVKHIETVRDPAPIKDPLRKVGGKFVPDPHMVAAIEENAHDRIADAGD